MTRGLKTSHHSKSKRTISLYSVLFLATVISVSDGCSTLKSNGNLLMNDDMFREYHHAAVSPKTIPGARSAAANSLVEKGFIVYRSAVFGKVQKIPPDIPVLSVECRDAGMRLGKLGYWSQTMVCRIYDLRSGIPVYKGIGEYMGISVAENFYGSTAAALSDIPRVGDKGKSTIRVAMSAESQPVKKAAGNRPEGEAGQETAWPTGYGMLPQVITPWRVHSE